MTGLVRGPSCFKMHCRDFESPVTIYLPLRTKWKVMTSKIYMVSIKKGVLDRAKAIMLSLDGTSIYILFGHSCT